MTTTTSFGSSIHCKLVPLKVKRTFLLLFGHTDIWYAKYLSGYTHVCLFEYISEEFMICHEPILIGCQTMFRSALSVEDLSHLKEWKVVQITVTPTAKNRLIMPIFQTCATIVQYLAGISLGCMLVDSLYKKLTRSKREWLKKQGIVGVNVWE
jgi:hypothetical protein